MDNFFSKDPVKQLAEVKEELYNQLRNVQKYLDEGQPTGDELQSVLCELKFYKKLFDKMERS